MRVDEERVREWNQFAERLVEAHQYRLETAAVELVETIGGYARSPAFYLQTEYRELETGRLLARVKLERRNPKNLHAIELYFYDGQGRLRLDYSTAYLPVYRNAPIQTLINVHGRDDDLRSFRQFDASGNIIFESCMGDYFGRRIDLQLEEGHVPPPNEVPEHLYVSCFGYLPLRADGLINPLAEVKATEKPASRRPDVAENAITTEIALLTAEISRVPDDAKAYAQRGHLYFQLQKLDDALADFERALKISDDTDAAYFGRGMVLGRLGRLSEAIRDLSVYIERHPESSLAHTKRGVRHIWNKDFKSAREDLEMAIFLDEANAEAHDDLGVVLAQLGELDLAIQHFLKARGLDPGYQKVHHNLGMVYYMKNDQTKALSAVNASLRLQPDSKSSLMLKATILSALGRMGEADRLRQRAETLPEGNWSERSQLR